MKGFVKFIIMFMMLVIVYLAVMFHMDYFIANHDGELQSYINPYYKYKDNESIFYKLGTLERFKRRNFR